jgi:hypothetical protein
LKSLLRRRRRLPQGHYFQDKRKCQQCKHFIRVDEDYDYIYVGNGLEKIYYCETCLENSKEVEGVDDFSKEDGDWYDEES